MIQRTLSVVLCTLFAAAAVANDRTSVVGHWASPGSIFEIYEKDDTLYGQIRVLKEPLYDEGERQGQQKVDDLNPDPELKGQPIVGLHMFSEYEYKNGQWQGKIYDPESGNIYQSRMEIARDGTLEIRGYIGIPMFGRTATFLPVSACEPHIIDMLEQLSSVDAC
jgi:uncharacterized protein (DUF2147 family)